MIIKFTYKGKSLTKEGVDINITSKELKEICREEFGLDTESFSVKLLHKGKKLADSNEAAFPQELDEKGANLPVTTRKLMVIATSRGDVIKLNTGRSDPTIRGFETSGKTIHSPSSVWGTTGGQHRKYRFCKLEACTWQSFGHRPTDSTPHAFESMKLLEKMANDPGVVAIMMERELVVNTLGEMDPIDDRIMQQKQSDGSGGCLLGYNTNHGLRIDIKLRTDDLSGFLPYGELISTLIHELSHNWVGEHNTLFWTNFGQMRIEYLYKHHCLAASGNIINGHTTVEVAGIVDQCRDGLTSIFTFVMGEMTKEMMQHGISPIYVEAGIRARCEELKRKESRRMDNRLTLGGGGGEGNTNKDTINNGSGDSPTSKRERALAAALKRANQPKTRERENPN